MSTAAPARRRGTSTLALAAILGVGLASLGVTGTSLACAPVVLDGDFELRGSQIAGAVQLDGTARVIDAGRGFEERP